MNNYLTQLWPIHYLFHFYFYVVGIFQNHPFPWFDNDEQCLKKITSTFHTLTL